MAEIASTDNERKVALEWSSRVAIVAHAHYRAAGRFSSLHFWLGIPTIVLATIVGTSVFASLQNEPAIGWKITIGLMSISAAILAAVHSFLNYNDRAERHRTAGVRYNAIGRELEQLLARDGPWSELTSVRRLIDNLAEESPHIPKSTFEGLKEIPVKPLWKN